MVFPVVMYGCESCTVKKAECQRIDAFELWCWRRLLRAPWTAKRSNQLILKETVLNVHWKDWCWSCNTLATWCKELTHWKRPWCWERLKADGEGDNRGWDGWMASPTQWTWVWASSGNWMDMEAWSRGFPYFFQFKSELGNKEFRIWATVSSQSYFCWLYRASPSLVAKNIINLILVLTIWWWPCVQSSLVLLKEGVCYDQCILLAKLC